MLDLYIAFARRQDHVLTPHGLFRLANPDAIVPGRIHVVRYHPFDQFAVIVAVGMCLADGVLPHNPRGAGPPAPP
jgi:hypothetical protein